MPEPLIHFAVPFASLSMIGVRPKIAFLASILAVLSDLDFLIGVHRSITHSLILLLLVSTIAYLLVKKSYKELILFCAIGFSSHIFLDLFSGYTPMLWPLYDRSVWISLGLDAHLGSSLSLTTYADILTEPMSFESYLTLDAAVITSEGIATSSFLLAPTIIQYLKKRLGSRLPILKNTVKA